MELDIDLLYNIMYGFIAVAALLIFFSVFKRTRRKRKEKKEMQVTAVADMMSMKRAAINTSYLEKMLFEIVQSVTLARYTQNPNAADASKLHKPFYDSFYQNLKREYDNHIRKQIYAFDMTKARVVKQDNSSMYAVTHLTVEGSFVVDYLYSHPTLTRRIKKEFKQRFVFMRFGEDWVLKELLEETDVVEQEAI